MSEFYYLFCKLDIIDYWSCTCSVLRPALGDVRGGCGQGRGRGGEVSLHHLRHRQQPAQQGESESVTENGAVYTKQCNTICSEENSLRKFIQTSYIKQIHQNSEYLLDKCYMFFFKLLNLIFLIQSSTVVNNKACKLAHYLMLVVNVPGC